MNDSCLTWCSLWCVAPVKCERKVLHASVLSFLRHAPQPPGLYPNLPCKVRSQVRVRHTHPQMAEGLHSCLERYIFLKIQAYRTQEKRSPEAHDCKFPQGNMPLDTPWRSSTFDASVLASWCFERSTFWQVRPPPSKRLATGLLAAMLSVCTCSGTSIALAERLLTQLLSSRSDK